MNVQKRLYAGLLIASVLMIGCATSYKPDNDTIDACTLTKPPEEVKVKDAGHLGQLVGYPKEISSKYNGCRKVWLTDHGSLSRYELFAIFHFNDGLINQVELFDEEKNIKEVCEFDKNKILTKGPLEHCSPYEVFENW